MIAQRVQLLAMQSDADDIIFTRFIQKGLVDILDQKWNDDRLKYVTLESIPRRGRNVIRCLDTRPRNSVSCHTFPHTYKFGRNDPSD